MKLPLAAGGGDSPHRRLPPGRSSGAAATPSLAARMARPDSFDGRFHYCRGQYRMNPAGDGGSWLTDYPLADIDLSIRLAELTRMRVGVRPGPASRNTSSCRLTGAELFQCPMIMMQEVGRLFFTDEDATQLRTYLLKGGFLWVDDFWGSYAWNTWATQIRKVFPPDEYPIVDLPIGASDLPHDVRAEGGTADSRHRLLAGQRRRHVGARRRQRRRCTPAASPIAPAELMVLMTHNTDVSDSWEREGEDPRYFYRFSVEGYQVAMNVLHLRDDALTANRSRAHRPSAAAAAPCPRRAETRTGCPRSPSDR